MTDTAAPKRHEESSFSIVNFLSIMVVLGYLAFMPLWMFFPPENVKPEVLAIINQMMGAWGYAFAAVIGYHLGSSKGAKDAAVSNREALSKMSDTVASTAATAATVAGTAAAAAGVPTNGAAETAAWNAAATANTADAFESYVAKFPTGVHAADARTRAAALRNP